MPHRFALIPVLMMALALAGGCSMRSFAVNTIGDMLASGDSVFTDDDDIELIGEALPFSLKLTESLLAESPRHRGLLLTAARGYVLYSYAYVHFAAEQAAGEDFEQARHLRVRASRLYLRAFEYAIRGLEIGHPGIAQALARSPVQALASVDDDVAFLYWGASALGLAISVSKDDTTMLARLPEVEALLRRGLVVDEAYDDGALHEFALIWASAVPGARDQAAIERHYQRALELSAGQRASLYVAFAMTEAVPAQDRQQFRDLMNAALAIDPDAQPGKRLLTIIAQSRARWLLARVDELFLE